MFLNILKSDVFQNVILPMVIVKLTISADRKLVLREENKKIKISTFKLFTDMHSKITSIQNFFKIYNDESLCDFHIYNPYIFNYSYRDIETYLVDISHRLEIIDLQVIRTFYINYQNLIEPLNELAIENNESLYVDRYKKELKAYIDREYYIKLERMYNECIYKNEELEYVLYKLKNIIIKIENKENIMNLVKNNKEKTFKNFKKIDINTSVYDLEKNKEPVYRYY